MESVFLFALIAIGSSVFAAIKQDAERQKKAQATTKTNIPNMQSTVNSSMKKSKPNITMEKKKNIQSNTIQKDASDNSVNMYGEGIQTEGLKENVPQQMRRTADKSVNDSSLTAINYDDLQRSIIMAEVLGKPRALKKNIR